MMIKPKKILAIVMVVTSTLLSTACDFNDNPKKDDPTPIICEENQELVDGICVEKEDETPITCEEDQELKEGLCVDKEIEDPIEDIYENSTLVSLEEMMNNLIGSPFTNNIYTESDLGISNSTIIGVDESTFNQVLYPVPDESIGTTYNVLDYGVSTESNNNSIAINTLINSIKDTEGIKKIYFPEGIYRFGSSIEIDKVKDLYIYGDNTEFILTGWISAIKISDSENIHINGINFDYDPSPTIAGVINNVDLAAKKVTIRVNDEFDLSNPVYNNGKISYGSYIEFRYDELTDSLIPNENGNLLYNSTGNQVYSIADGVYHNSSKELELTFSNMKSVSVGTHVSVAFTMYDAHGIDVEESKNVYFESLNIYTSAGMTIRSDQSENMYINNVNVALKEGSSRLMTATADIIHTCGNYGDMIITNGIYEYSHDDAMNFKSFYRTISNVNGRIITAQAANQEANLKYEIGDVIEIYNPQNFELYGTYDVTNVESSGLVYTITVDKTIREDIKDFLVGNATKSPNLVIRNNIIRNKRNRGILVQVRNSDISNNTFQNVLHGTLSYLSVADIFSEAIMPRNITVQNNKFINNNTLLGLEGDVAIMTYGLLGYNNGGTTSGSIINVDVSNNFFYKGGNAAVSFTGGGEASVYNNLFYDTSKRFRNQTYNTIVRVYTSENIEIKDNVTYMINKDIDFIKEDEHNQNIVVENNSIIKE